jgi:myosin heavy subunit
MSDTEEIVIKRQPKNTKPEVAREKLKEKRERLKKEKENMIIEEAKKRLAEEAVIAEQQKKDEEEKKLADPMMAMLRKMDEMMSSIRSKSPPEPASLKAPKKVAKKEPKVKEPKPKAAPKPRASKKKVYYEAEDSPSNIFLGRDVPPPGPPIYYCNQYEQQEQPVNPLVAHLMGRRNLSAY